MSTPATLPPEGLSAQAVARAIGLSRSSIYQAAETARLGSPAHFRYSGNAIVYTAQGLHQLAEGLETMREDGAARLLRALLGRARQEAALEESATTPSAPAVEGWLARFERRQEEQAA